MDVRRLLLHLRGRPPLDEPVTPAGPRLDEVRSCERAPHVRAVAAEPLSWAVIDELHRHVSAGREAHLVLAIPRSPVSRDAELHARWERRMAGDIADRVGEVAQLWPGSRLVRIEVTRTDPSGDGPAGTAVGPAGGVRWVARRR